MTEHGFIRYVHSKLDTRVLKWKIHDTFAGGVPDAFYMGPRSTLWIEYKYVKALPVRSTTTIKTCLTEGQRIWLDDLHRCKQACALAIGCKDQVLVLTDGGWRSDITRDEFLANAISRKELAKLIEAICL